MVSTLFFLLTFLGTKHTQLFNNMKLLMDQESNSRILDARSGLLCFVLYLDAKISEIKLHLRVLGSRIIMPRILMPFPPEMVTSTLH